jgi:hypothetical protein
MTAGEAGAAARTMIVALALARIIASYPAASMNVAISAIARDLRTTVAGVQTAITLFTLTMAALMIPGPGVLDRQRAGRLGLGGGQAAGGQALRRRPAHLPPAPGGHRESQAGDGRAI